MKGKCYLVATPIGNLGDITLRALETLKAADIIACEDTRHSLKLLNHYGIKKPLISFHKFNEPSAAETILSKLEEGKSVAVISDAGMPCVSDPGAELVKKLRENGYDYTVIPGANAAVCAAALAGLKGGFYFAGFLSDKKKEREKQLEEIENLNVEALLYCAPHDVNDTLKGLYSRLGARKVCLVKEITKIHESVTEGILGEISVDDPKGEYVLIVAPKEAESSAIISDGEILSALEECIRNGLDKRAAVTSVCEKLKLAKNKVYKLSLKL